jgi:hypothetical protein
VHHQLTSAPPAENVEVTVGQEKLRERQHILALNAWSQRQSKEGKNQKSKGRSVHLQGEILATPMSSTVIDVFDAGGSGRTTRPWSDPRR